MQIETINIGSTNNIDIPTLAEVVGDAIDPSIKIQYTEARESDAEHTPADISKATQLIGCEPSRGIREGVSDFITWRDPLVLNS